MDDARLPSLRGDTPHPERQISMLDDITRDVIDYILASGSERMKTWVYFNKVKEAIAVMALCYEKDVPTRREIDSFFQKIREGGYDQRT